MEFGFLNTNSSRDTNITPQPTSVSTNMSEAFGHGLNAGYDIFKKGFTEAGLEFLPNKLQDKITRLGYASYADFIMAKTSNDSRFWAPEIREQRLKITLIPYIYGIVHDLQNDMALELNLRVNDPEDPWNHDKAQDFANKKAGNLLLALFGDFNPIPHK